MVSPGSLRQSCKRLQDILKGVAICQASTGRGSEGWCSAAYNEWTRVCLNSFHANEVGCDLACAIPGRAVSCFSNCDAFAHMCSGGAPGVPVSFLAVVPRGAPAILKNIRWTTEGENAGAMYGRRVGMHNPRRGVGEVG